MGCPTPVTEGHEKAGRDMKVKADPASDKKVGQSNQNLCRMEHDPKTLQIGWWFCFQDVLAHGHASSCSLEYSAPSSILVLTIFGSM